MNLEHGAVGRGRQPGVLELVARHLHLAADRAQAGRGAVSGGPGRVEVGAARGLRLVERLHPSELRVGLELLGPGLSRGALRLRDLQREVGAVELGDQLPFLDPVADVRLEAIDDAGDPEAEPRLLTGLRDAAEDALQRTAPGADRLVADPPNQALRFFLGTSPARRQDGQGYEHCDSLHGLSSDCSGLPPDSPWPAASLSR